LTRLRVEPLLLTDRPLQPSIQVGLAALVFGQRNDPAQVGIGEALALLVKLPPRPLELLPARLRLLRRPNAAPGSSQRLAHAFRMRHDQAEVRPDQVI
jgi:hypothetical protein